MIQHRDFMLAVFRKLKVKCVIFDVEIISQGNSSFVRERVKGL